MDSSDGSDYDVDAFFGHKAGVKNAGPAKSAPAPVTATTTRSTAPKRGAAPTRQQHQQSESDDEQPTQASDDDSDSDVDEVAHEPMVLELPPPKRSSAKPSNTTPAAAVNDTAGFAELGVHPTLVHHLATRLGITAPTPIQRGVYRSLLVPHKPCDRDLAIQSETGSGKTLAFLVPVLQQILFPAAEDTSLSRDLGPLMLVLAPTRELAQQIHGVVESLIHMARAARSSTIGADESDQKEDVEDAESGIARPRHWLVSSVIIGGESKKSEKARIRKGINILVSTPGRFLDHLRTTRALDVSGVRWVVLDEADRLLDLGFERDLKSIFAYLHGLPDPGRKTPDGKPIVINEGLQPKPLPMPPVPAWTRRRQVILCSATMAKVARLAAWVLKDPLRVSATGQLKSWAKLTSRGDGDDHDGVDGSGSDDDDEDNGEGAGSGPVGLKHEYLVVPLKLKLHALCAYLATMARGAHIQGTPRKIIVFFSTRGAVDFYHAVLAKFFGASDRTDPLLGFQEKLDVRKLHGSMDANERKAAMAGFAGDAAAVAAARAAGVAARRPASKKGKAYDENMPVASGTRGQVLITTDVAARGLDLHGVDLIIQYDAPTDVSEYVHRVGRTARAGRRGAAVLMLAPHEEDFATKILSEKVTMSSIDVTALIGKLLRCARTEGAWEKAAVRQWQIPMEDWVAKDKIARNLAMLGFQAHVKGYATYPSALKPIFHVRKLHLGHLAKSFCLRDAPTDLSQVLGQNQKAAAASAAAAPGGSKDWKANGGARKRVFADGVESYTKTAQALQMRAMASEFNTSMPDRKRRRM